jgi:hypothetical protein
MSMTTESSSIVTLDEFDVVAIDGEGVFIVDDENNCWHVGGPYEPADEDNKLVRAYRNAF